MKKIFFVLALIISGRMNVQAQEFIPLWPKGNMPDSKGLRLKDSITNERVYKVGTPGMYAFFPSSTENKGAAVVICPGGGYERLAYIISGTQLAKWFNTMGVSAFVLNYRLPNSPDLKQQEKGPLLDAQRALKLIRAHAAEWKLDTARIGIQGSSAGGHLASLAGTAVADISAIGDSLDRQNYKPSFMILVSPVIDMGVYAHKGSRKNLLGEHPDDTLVRAYSSQLRVTDATAPTFIADAFNDPVVSPKNSLLFYEALLEHHVPSALHIFQQGGHAIALRNNPGSTEWWTTLCEAWMKEAGFLEDKK